MGNLESAAVREAAKGRWLMIYNHVAPELVHALKYIGHHVECPVHGGKDKDGFRLFKDANLSGGGICNSCGPRPDGFGLLQWLKGWTFPQALEAVAGALGFEGTNPPKECRREAPAEPPPPDPAEDERIRLKLLKVWTEAVPISDDKAEPARRWLRRRGLNESVWARHPELIRFSYRKLPYHHRKELLGYWPAIVAMMYGRDGMPATLHRTFITDDGDRAPVPKIRKQMEHTSYRSTVGGYIPIGKPTAGVIGLAEGLETALAVTLATGMPCWPTTSWSMQVKFKALDHVDDYVIWADKDRQGTGQRFARVTQQALWEQGKRAQVQIPPFEIPDLKKGIDWNDVYQQYGAAGFPRLTLLQRLANTA